MPQIIPASPWVADHCRHIPAGGCVLDLACGNGRHARLLADRGYRVLAVDRNVSALESLSGIPEIEARAADLETEIWPLADERFAGIVVTNYLWRARLPDLLACLVPGGVLIYETFMLGNETYGKPSNPEFLLRPGELRAIAAGAGLVELAWAEGYVDRPKPAMRQAIVAQRPI